MDPFFHTGLSISDSLKSVRKSVLIYETIIQPLIEKYPATFQQPEHLDNSHMIDSRRLHGV